jgi:hypothetical protein
MLKISYEWTQAFLPRFEIEEVIRSIEKVMNSTVSVFLGCVCKNMIGSWHGVLILSLNDINIRERICKRTSRWC